MDSDNDIHKILIDKTTRNETRCWVLLLDTVIAGIRETTVFGENIDPIYVIALGKKIA
jgi:hypothetical protein